MKQSCSRHLGIMAALLCLAGCGQSNSTAHVPSPPPTTTTPTSNEPLATRPQIVRVQKVEVGADVTHIDVGNESGHFSLYCARKQDSCITPVSGGDYFLFTKETKWKFPGAKEPVTLKFFQDFSGSYNAGENVALVPVVRNQTNQYDTKGDWGIFWLESWEAK